MCSFPKAWLITGLRESGRTIMDWLNNSAKSH